MPLLDDVETHLTFPRRFCLSNGTLIAGIVGVAAVFALIAPTYIDSEVKLPDCRFVLRALELQCELQKLFPNNDDGRPRMCEKCCERLLKFAAERRLRQRRE